MNSYSHFFQTLHDETGPVGHLGRGTHYSVIRSVAWIDKTLQPMPSARFHDLAIIWDEDHDTRVIDVIERLYFSGLLSPAIAIGERKGGVTVILPDNTPILANAVQFQDYSRSLLAQAENQDDPWCCNVGTVSNPDALINAPAKMVTQYIQTIDMLWSLGIADPQSRTLSTLSQVKI